MSSQSFEILPDAQGRLTLRRPGHGDVHDVRLCRAFPWTCPNRFISVRSGEGKELILIDDLAALGPSQRQVIENWLADAVFIPRISRIERVELRFGHQRWQVQTDRGAIEFRVQEREDIRFLPDGRFSVKDADGNVYELPRLDELDAPSRRALESLI